MSDRRRRLAAAHLYLVCDAQPDPRVRAALAGGVDIVQLRLKDADDETIAAAAARLRPLCQAAGALFIINDRPDLVLTLGADGVHVGQDDAGAAAARAAVGPERLVGLSTHSPAQIAAAPDEIDYIGVGPVHTTPTKPGRPAVGLELVRHAAEHAGVPFFAIGGIDTDNVAAVSAAGARRIAVVRAITTAADPERAARTLRAAVTGRDRVGAA